MYDWSGSPYYQTAINAANTYGVPAQLFVQQIGQESSFNPNAYNSASGATGIAQFLPSTAADFGINPMDPTQSLNAAAQYDAQLYNKTGSWDAALQSYSGGSYGAAPDLSGVQLIGGSGGGITGGSGGTSSSNPFTLATSGSTWARIGLVVVGMIVLAAGLFMLGRNGHAMGA